MVIWPDGRVTCVINDNIEETTQTIYRTGKDNSRYMTFHNGCNVNTTLVYIILVDAMNIYLWNKMQKVPKNVY